MFSRLQATFPVLTDDVHVGRWIRKIFPWKTDNQVPPNSVLDYRESYRLDMQNLQPLDATFVTETGVIVDINVLNLSAGGLSGMVSCQEPLYSDQVFTLIFVLPLEEPILVKTEARLVAIDPNESPDSRVLHIEFSKDLDARHKDQIHGYIVQKQLEMIQRRKRMKVA